MATVKKNKKKLITIIAVVLAVVIAVTSSVIYAYGKKKETADVYTINAGDIYETINSTGKVSSGAIKEFKVGSVATVKEVFISVGDSVKEGDVLATFDTSNLDSQIKKLEESNKESTASYNAAVKEQKAAQKKLNVVNKEIKKLEKEIAKIQKGGSAPATTTTKPFVKPEIPTEIEDTTAPTEATTKPEPTKYYTVKASVEKGQTNYGTVAVGNNAAGSTSSGTYAQGSVVTFKAEAKSGLYTFDGWYDTNGNKLKSSSRISVTVNGDLDYVARFRSATSESGNLADVLAEIADSINQMTDDVSTALELMTIVVDTLAQQAASGATSADQVAEAIEKAINNAITSGLINEDNLNVAASVIGASVADAIRGADWKSIANEFTSTKDVALATRQMQLAGLEAQAQIYGLQANGTTVSMQKKAMNSTQEALDVLKQSAKELETGWIAPFDGTITECDLVAGEQASIIAGTIKLENLNSMVVKISLTEYDNYKVKVGMGCVISTVYGKYEGEVISKSPVASGGSSSSIMDSVGSMAGISGLSSLTDQGAGIECMIRVDKPDENIIVGFDANVEISTGQYMGVTVVPIESIILEKTGTYVYVYDAEEGMATKKQIQTGAVSDSVYQVTEGLNVGDKIIAAPSTTYKEDSFKVKVSKVS